MYEGTKLHEDDFAPRVNFARVTVLHEKKNTEKNKIKTENKLKYDLVKKKLLTKVRVRGNSDSKNKKLIKCILENYKIKKKY